MVSNVNTGTMAPQTNDLQKHTGRFKYKDITWYSIDLPEAIDTYTRVHFMLYRIQPDELSAVMTEPAARSQTAPDIDAHGTGNIHPSMDRVADANALGQIQQLVLVSNANPARHYGPALPKHHSYGGKVYHLANADVPAANFYPPIEPMPTMTDAEQQRQNLLRSIAADFGLIME